MVFGQSPIGTGQISSGIKVGNAFHVITITGSLVASNAIDLDINGVAVTQTTYANSADYTMRILAKNIAANPKVEAAVYLGYNEAENAYKVRIKSNYQNLLNITNPTITGGVSQPSISQAYVGGVEEIPFLGTQDNATRLTQRVDDTTTSNITYYGFALANSDEADPVWYIYILDETTATNVMTIFPNTGAAFDYVWDNRASYTYA